MYTRFFAILVLVISILGVIAKVMPSAFAWPGDAFPLAAMLTLLALFFGYIGSAKVPPFRQVSKLLTIFGFFFFWGLPAAIEFFALRAIYNGQITLGGKGGLSDHHFSLSNQPTAFWITFVIYMIFVSIFSAVAFRHFRDAYERYRAHV